MNKQSPNNTSLRARLHLAIAMPLRWRCDNAPKSNVCIRSCTVTHSVCDCYCNITGGLLGIALWAIQERCRCDSGVAVAVCKWALSDSKILPFLTKLKFLISSWNRTIVHLWRKWYASFELQIISFPRNLKLVRKVDLICNLLTCLQTPLPMFISECWTSFTMWLTQQAMPEWIVL